MWIDGCEQFKCAQQGGLNFNELFIPSAVARYPAAVTFGLYSKFLLCSTRLWLLQFLHWWLAAL